MGYNSRKKIGVIVGRFQTPYLHKGHLHLIETALKENDVVIIFIGVTRHGIRNDKNPYSYQFRGEVLEYHLSNNKDKFLISSIEDIPGDDRAWSILLDHTIVQKCRGHMLIKENNDYSAITLYGSRDSFLEVYKGGFTVKMIDSHGAYSSTAIREQLIKLEKVETNE